MHTKPVIQNAAGRLAAALVFAAPLFVMQAQTPPDSQAAAPAQGQNSAPTQTQAAPPAQPASLPPEERQYVGHFLLYAGWVTLDTPALSLVERGVHLQAGMRWSRHISVGVDYSRATGSNSIGLGLATASLQAEVNPLIASLKATGIIPQNYVAALPLASTTQTLTAGPEFPYRRFNRFTPYIRPSIGFIFENATAEPNDFLTRTLVKSIAPSGMESQITEFYGFGGGVGLNFTKHFSLVIQGDFVHYHLFPSLLASGTNAVRFSLGPGVQFGKNVTTKWGIPGHWD
jgi:hypothetical protein